MVGRVSRYTICDKTLRVNILKEKAKMKEKFLANALGQVSAYSVSVASFMTTVSDWVGVLSGLAGVLLTVTLAWGNYKIKSAEARIKNAEAHRMEIENQNSL